MDILWLLRHSEETIAVNITALQRVVG